MPSWLVVLVLSVVALAGAGAWLTAVSREKRRLGFLHTTALALLEARDLDAAAIDVLRRASRRFRAESAELTLIPETGTAAAFRTTVRGGEPTDVMRSADLEDDDDGTLTPPIYGVVHIAEASADPWVTRLCGRVGVSRGLAVTLRHRSRTVGYLALGMRASNRRIPRAYDGHLQDLANLLALAIERSRLHDSLLRLSAL